jgi:hypothetical protein
MAPRKRPDGVPKNWKEWSKAAKKLEVYGKSVHTRERFESGSRVTMNEYLLFRALWVPRIPKSRVVSDLELVEQFKEARERLNSFAPFQQYLQSIENSTKPGISDLGIFEIPYAQQEQACELLNRPKHKLPWAINEEIVNSSLVSFLTAICLKNPKVDASWTSHRTSFGAAFRQAKLAEKESLSCEIDGFLLSSASQTQLFLEAKARDRKSHQPQVCMQEAYELIAAVLTEPPKGLPENR